jgi:MFS superfamily sulfate permease-like transporter
MDDTADTICPVGNSKYQTVTSLMVCFRLFFNILHPPLNVPALCTFCLPDDYLTANTHVAVSLDEDIDTNKELVAHGYSNLLAGFLGTV